MKVRINYSSIAVVLLELTDPKGNSRVTAWLSGDSCVMEGSTPLVLFFLPPLMESLDHSTLQSGTPNPLAQIVKMVISYPKFKAYFSSTSMTESENSQDFRGTFTHHTSGEHSHPVTG